MGKWNLNTKSVLEVIGQSLSDKMTGISGVRVLRWFMLTCQPTLWFATVDWWSFVHVTYSKCSTFSPENPSSGPVLFLNTLSMHANGISVHEVPCHTFIQTPSVEWWRKPTKSPVLCKRIPGSHEGTDVINPRSDIGCCPENPFECSHHTSDLFRTPFYSYFHGHFYSKCSEQPG